MYARGEHAEVGPRRARHDEAEVVGDHVGGQKRHRDVLAPLRGNAWYEQIVAGFRLADFAEERGRGGELARGGAARHEAVFPHLGDGLHHGRHGADRVGRDALQPKAPALDVVDGLVRADEPAEKRLGGGPAGDDFGAAFGRPVG